MKDTSWCKPYLTAVVLAITAVNIAVSLTGPSAHAAEPPKPLDAAAYNATRTLIKPGDDEWQWRHIDWLQSVSAAQKKAADEGKPILLSGAAQGSVIGCL
jgi:hypothetical protein